MRYSISADWEVNARRFTILCCSDWSFSAEQSLYCDKWCILYAGCFFSSLYHFSIGRMRFTSMLWPRYITCKHTNSSQVIKNAAVVLTLMMDIHPVTLDALHLTPKECRKQCMQTSRMSWYSLRSPKSKCDAGGALLVEDEAGAQLNNTLFVRVVFAITADVAGSSIRSLCRARVNSSFQYLCQSKVNVQLTSLF